MAFNITCRDGIFNYITEYIEYIQNLKYKDQNGDLKPIIPQLEKLNS